MSDGSIMIEAKVSTDKFDKQIQKLDEKIQKKEKEKIKLEADIKNKKEREEFCRIYIIEYSLNIKRRHSCTTQKN